MWQLVRENSQSSYLRRQYNMSNGYEKHSDKILVVFGCATNNEQWLLLAHEIKIGWYYFVVFCWKCFFVKNDEKRQVDDYCLSFVQCYNFDYHSNLLCVYEWVIQISNQCLISNAIQMIIIIVIVGSLIRNIFSSTFSWLRWENEREKKNNNNKKKKSTEWAS